MNEDLVLIKEAKKAREAAYAPYSNFLVGAALLGESGKVYLGCNIENASYGASNCAERTALFKDVSEGEKRFVKIAIVGAKRGEAPKDLCPPCGICRQVMLEFCDPETFQILLEENQTLRTYLLKDLLPYSFGSTNL